MSGSDVNSIEHKVTHVIDALAQLPVPEYEGQVREVPLLTKRTFDYRTRAAPADPETSYFLTVYVRATRYPGGKRLDWVIKI